MTVARRLHEIRADYIALEELLLEAGGEITPEAEALMAEMADNLEGKVDAYAALIREWEADAEKWKAEEVRVAGHRRARENAAAALKSRLVGELVAMDRLKVETPRFKVAVQRAAGTVEVLAMDPASLPSTLVRRIPEVVEPNKKAILDALKASGEEELRGADGELLARMAPGNQYLRIR